MTIAEPRMRLAATTLFRALRSVGEEGLSYKECSERLSDTQNEGVGATVVWLRSKGIVIEARYVAGETRFVLVPTET